MQRRSLVNKRRKINESAWAWATGSAAKTGAWIVGVIIVLIAVLLFGVIPACSVRSYNDKKSQYDVQNDSINKINPHPNLPDLKHTEDNDSTLNNLGN